MGMHKNAENNTAGMDIKSPPAAIHHRNAFIDRIEKQHHFPVLSQMTDGDSFIDGRKILVGIYRQYPGRRMS